MNWNTCHRLRILNILISIGLISGFILSWKLWISSRTFPHFPVFEFLPPFLPPFDGILFGGALLLALLQPFYRHGTTATLLLGFLMALALQDQMRWQPWFYQYLLMLLPYAFVSNSKYTESQSESILAIQRLIIAAIYFWSGIHKCHAGFIDVFQGSLIAPVTLDIGYQKLVSLINASAYLVPLIEIAVGIGLLFRPTRKAATAVAIATHLIILILIGPVKGTISNSVVWPWNITMIAMLIVLFYKQENPSIKAAYSVPRLRIPNGAITLLVVFTPILFYFGSWDRYLSFNLYSGWQRRLYVRIAPEAAEQLPEYLRRQYLKKSISLDGHKVISASRWATEELNVPFISEWRILRSFAKELSQYDSGNNEIIFLVDYRNRPDLSKRIYRCNEIEKMNRKDFFQPKRE